MARKLLLGIVFLALAACSRQADTPQKQRDPRARELVRVLGEADRVIVLHPDGSTLVLADEQLKKLVQAIRGSKKLSSEPLATPGYTLIFFNGIAHLATVPTGAGIIFYIDQAPYEDESGTLRAVCDKFLWKHPASRL